MPKSTRWAAKAKAKRPPTKHAQILNAVKSILKSARVWHWKHASGPFSQPGISDILGIKKTRVADLVAAGVEEVGVFIAIEIKTGPTDTPTDNQVGFIQNVNDNGGIAFVTWTPEEVVERLGLFGKIYPLFYKTKDV